MIGPIRDQTGPKTLSYAAGVTADPHLRHRILDTTVTIRRPDGTPHRETEVVVEQTGHEFTFGNIGFDFVGLVNGPDDAGADLVGSADPDAARELADLWLDLFNTATLPFYWARFEPDPGRPDTERLLATARWFRDRGVRLKGHPLLWHTLAPSWLRDRPTDEIETTCRQRIRREVTDFAGLIDTWDAINEVVIMPVFANEPQRNAITRLARERGRIHVARLAFEEARAANPGATLLLNDFDLSTAYECLIEGLLEAGVRIDALGLQTHMHQGYWGEERTLEVIDRFARYGLPLHFTETTLVSGDLMPPEIEDLNDYQPAEWASTPEGEERQADELVRHYRTLLSHPAVEAITYWGITDRGAWLGAPAGLVRRDGSPKPAYDALRRLLKEEWWLPPTTLRTDADGRVRVSGWAGEYRATVAGRSADFTVAAGAAPDLMV